MVLPLLASGHEPVIWLQFAGAAIVIIGAGILAAVMGDAIAVRTGLGRVLFGTVLLAAATSLPDLAASFDSVRAGIPDLAAGDLLGGIIMDILFLGLLDLFTVHARLLHRVAITHSLTATLATLMVGMASFFTLVPLGLQWGSADLEGLLLLAAFVGGTWLIRLQSRTIAVPAQEVPPSAVPLGWAIVGFVAAAALLVLVSPLLVSAANEIARLTGVGAGFVGLALLPLVTNMPDLASSVAAVRLGAYDLAVGNFFGTCVFNVAALALVSLFYGPGSLFSAISPGFVVVGLLAIILITVALLGTLARLEWRLLSIDVDAALVILIYLAGIYLIYRQGVLLVTRGA